MSIDNSVTFKSFFDADEDHNVEKTVVRKPKIKYLNNSVFEEHNNTVILRFLDDFALDENGENGVINLATHSSVPTKAEPDNFPESMNWFTSRRVICRTQRALGNQFDSCYVCDNIKKTNEKGQEYRFPKTPTGYGRAALRELVKVTQDMIDEYELDQKMLGRKVSQPIVETVAELDKNGEPTGNETEQPIVYLVEKQKSNFWGNLVGAWSMNETILDRDYAVTKEGTGYKLNFTFTAMAETAEDLRKPEDREPYDEALPYSRLQEHVFENLSQDYITKFFDPSEEWDWQSGSSESDEAKVEEPEEDIKIEDSDEARAKNRKAFRQSLMGNHTKKSVSD